MSKIEKLLESIIKELRELRKAIRDLHPHEIRALELRQDDEHRKLREERGPAH